MKEKIITYSFIIFISLFLILHILIPDKKISIEERRTLSKFPKFELSNEYIEKLDNYLLEHFPFKSDFRTIKAYYNYNLVNKLDNNNIYIKDNYIFKSNYPTNKKSIDNFINKTKKVMSCLNKDNNIYVMVIPDKNHYIKDDYFLKIDYDYIDKKISKLPGIKINIKENLNLKDYYETDTHWRQEKLPKVVKEMSKYLDFGYKDIKYEVNTYDNFYGVLYNESAIKRNPDTLKYLKNDIIDNVDIKYYEDSKLKKVYNVDKLKGLDPYDVYLNGATSYIEITNNYSNTGKELVVFRDSFGSSLVPLLIEYYDKITIIDNRYISSEYYLKLIDFDNQDVLFMYSTLLINDSYALKG